MTPYQRRGSSMLMVLVLITFMGIFAVRLIPSYETEQKRQNEALLHSSIGRIRQAFDMKAYTDPTFTFDVSSATAIQAAISQLRDENYLPNDRMMDRTISTHLWGTGTTDIFWQAVDNLASNPSFELTDGTTNTLASWTPGTSDTESATRAIGLPAELDDYQGQNKYGQTLEQEATIITITK